MVIYVRHTCLRYHFNLSPVFIPWRVSESSHENERACNYFQPIKWWLPKNIMYARVQRHFTRTRAKQRNGWVHVCVCKWRQMTTVKTRNRILLLKLFRCQA